VTEARIDPIEAIRNEIVRLRADKGSVGPIDAIYVDDRGGGYACLRWSPRGVNFLSGDEKVETIFARLLELDDPRAADRPRIGSFRVLGPANVRESLIPKTAANGSALLRVDIFEARARVSPRLAETIIATSRSARSRHTCATSTPSSACTAAPRRSTGLASWACSHLPPDAADDGRRGVRARGESSEPCDD
jgi:hypothetical protein